MGDMIFNIRLRKVLEFCIKNGLPAPSYLRWGSATVRVPQINMNEEGDPDYVSTYPVTLFGSICDDGDGKFRMELLYEEHIFDMGTWEDAFRSVRMIKLEITSPYFGNGTREYKLPLPPTFQIVTRCDHFENQSENVCCLCARPVGGVEVTVEPEDFVLGKHFRWTIRTEPGEAKCVLDVNDWLNPSTGDDKFANITIGKALGLLKSFCTRKNPQLLKVSWKVLGREEGVFKGITFKSNETAEVDGRPIDPAEIVSRLIA